MKKLVIGVFVILAFISFFVFTRKGSDISSNFQITKKTLTASSTNRAMIEGRVVNKGKDARLVILKAQLKDESGAVLDEPFVSLKDFKAGEEKEFKIESQADYYKVTSFEVFVDAAQ